MRKETLRMTIMASCIIIILSGFVYLNLGSPTGATTSDMDTKPNQLLGPNKDTGLWKYTPWTIVILALAGYYLMLDGSGHVGITDMTGELNRKINAANNAIDRMKYPEAYEIYMKITSLNPPEKKMGEVYDIYHKLMLFNHLNQMQTAAINGNMRTLNDHILIVSDLLNRIGDRKGQLYAMGVYYLQYYSSATPRKDNFGKLREMGRR